MKKKIRESIADVTINNYDNLTIDELLNKVIDLKNKGVTHVDISAEKDWDGSIESIDIEGYKEYEESEDQYQARLDREKKQVEYDTIRRKESKLREYNRLKNELGL